MGEYLTRKCLAKGKRRAKKKERHFWNRRTEKEREQKYLRRKQKNNLIALERLKKGDGLKKHETKFIFNSLVTREQLDGR